MRRGLSEGQLEAFLEALLVLVLIGCIKLIPHLLILHTIINE
jgi:hypothetical protein